MADVVDMRDEGDTIPNFLKLDQIPTNYVQQLETDLLEPVVFTQGSTTSDGFTRFTLQNKGFLHSHSKLFVALKPTATNTRNYLQPHVGIGQIIKKAVLKIGNKTLNEVDSWQGLYAVKSSLITNENNVEREQYLTGRVMNHGFRYDVDSSVEAPDYGLDNSVEYNTNDLSVPNWANMDHSKPEECPSYMIDLSDMFNFLKVHQLPLYMISEPINIELTFVPTVKERVQIPSTGTSDVATEIVRDQLKFCADYIYYGASDEMQRFANANKDMSFSFVDYRLVEHTISATELASGVVRNLGMANRIVPRVITLFADTGFDEDSIVGKYNSIAPFVNGSGAKPDLKYNIRYNDRFEFTSDIENVARLFSMTTHSESVPFITRNEFSGQAVSGGIATDTYEGRNQQDNLDGHFFNLSTKLTNGRVGQRGLELHVSGTFPSSGRVPDLLRCYCEYVRVARLVDGMFEVYNA